ncbi:hypothetical protein LUZ60_009966 [Juncus effusus]|nr:hypothetical protein LUZ60_009966 [Juncus effusus]
MASQVLCLIVLTSSFLLLPANGATAAGPTAAPQDVLTVLEKGGQYNTFIRLLKETQVETQLSSQLKNSFDGLTIFAPTDNAFNNLKAGTLNSLKAQDQSELVLYHILPRYYSFNTFETTSNPVRTQASGNEGVYTVNVTSTSNQVNVSTGVNEVPVNNALYSDFPLAVYSLDKVLLPSDLFGVKSPAPAPLAGPTVPKDKKKAPSTPVTAAVPSSEADTTNSDSNDVSRRNMEWGIVTMVFGLVGVLCFV